MEGRNINHYKTLKKKRGIKDTPQRQRLIERLLIAEEAKKNSSDEYWTYAQWDALEDKYLKLAWKEWGRKCYYKAIKK